MRKDGATLKRLRTLTALQSLVEQASRAQLSRARFAHGEACIALVQAEQAVGEKCAEVDRLMAADVLDFNQWRIGHAVLGNLAAEQATASGLVRERAEVEDAARAEWHRNDTAIGRLRRTASKLARRLAERSDEAGTAETVDLLLARTTGEIA